MPKPYTPNDAWSRRAAKEGYRARSVYKLMELDERFSLLKSGMTVLDLGCAPGSWMQYTVKRIGLTGHFIGMDVQEVKPVEGATTFVQDIMDIQGVSTLLAKQNIHSFDLILSDLAPSTSGVKDVDQWRSIELSQAVADIAERFLKSDGICVIKVLRGADFDSFLKQLKHDWGSVRTTQVEASRDRSKEIYVLLRKTKGRR
ncbi:MAG: RlmE family RNA methyltransferase [Candidatus Peribacteraceae bacterium]|nr:RlmE family RNA methyltransferase [Candidatus Peribacteraceae bacterium]